MTYEYDPGTERYHGQQPTTRRQAARMAVTTRTGYRRRPAPSAVGPIIIAAISLVLVVVVAFAVTEYNRNQMTPTQMRTLALSSVRQIPGYELKSSYFELLAEQSHPRSWRLACEDSPGRLSPERRQRLYDRQLLRRMAELAQQEGQEQIADACRTAADGLGE